MNNEFVRSCPVCKDGVLQTVANTEQQVIEKCFECKYEIVTFYTNPLGTIDKNVPEPVSNKRYCFVTDNDCHNYLIPLDKKEEFYKFNEMSDDEFNDHYDEWIKSDFDSYRIDSREAWSFENPQLEK